VADSTGQPDPEHLEQAAQLVFEVDALREDGLAARQQSAHLVACKLLTWTRLYQPVLRIWARPRASLRSVLLRIAARVTLTCLASRQMTSNPAACSP